MLIKRKYTDFGSIHICINENVPGLDKNEFIAIAVIHLMSIKHGSDIGRVSVHSISKGYDKFITLNNVMPYIREINKSEEIICRLMVPTNKGWELYNKEEEDEYVSKRLKPNIYL